MALVGVFAAFHGYAHAFEAPAAGAGTYILGFLRRRHCCRARPGAGLGCAAAVGDVGLRALGGMMLAAGAFVLIAN